MTSALKFKQTVRSSGRALFIAGLVGAPLALVGCNSSSNVLSHGYQLSEESLALVPEGSSREQVLLSLGTPSTTQGRANGAETFYYISQKKKRSIAFAKPKVVDQRVLAIYMNSDNTVEQIANYGLKDGKVFDFVARVTPSGGKDLSFIGQLLSSGGGAAASLGGALGGGPK